MKNISFIIEIVCLVVIVVCTYYLGTVNFINFNNFNNSNEPLLQNNVNCNSSILSESAECLRNDLMNFFKYNLSQVGKDINLTELKESGGVCHNFAQFYKDSLIDLGFNSKTIIIEADDVPHEITIAWTKNLSNGEYCIADQTELGCTKLNEVNITEYKELTQ